MGPGEPSVSISPLLGLQTHTTKPDFFLFFTRVLGIKPRSSCLRALYLESSSSSLAWSFLRSDCVRTHFQIHPWGFSQSQQHWPLIGLAWVWKRHRESYLQILEVAKRVTLLSFLALFFIWGLERVAARGRKPFETWSSSNWDKLKEMLLCRVESDLWEYYIPKAKGWEYTQIKSTSDIVINYVYENNPNGQQYGNS